jgi:hypothetical protein
MPFQASLTEEFYPSGGGKDRGHLWNTIEEYPHGIGKVTFRQDLRLSRKPYEQNDPRDRVGLVVKRGQSGTGTAQVIALPEDFKERDETNPLDLDHAWSWLTPV